MWYVEAGRGRKLPLTPEEGHVTSDAQKAAQASHAGSYSIRTEMRRSLYHRTFLAHSNLYRGTERRMSTLPGHLRLTVPVQSHNEARPTLPLRFSCSETEESPERPLPRPYRSADDDLDTADFPLRIKTDLSADTFRRSIDSASTSSYVSPFSHPIEELELDVFSRLSSEGSDEHRKNRNPIRKRLLSYQDHRDDATEYEISEKCASEGDSAMKTAPSSVSEIKHCLYKDESMDNDGTLSHISESEHGEGYEFALKQFEGFDQVCLEEFTRRDSDNASEEKRSNDDEADYLKDGVFRWKRDYSDDYDVDNLAANREEGAVSFKFDVLAEQRENSPPVDVQRPFNFRSSLFPGKRRPLMTSLEIKEDNEGEPDEGFESTQVDDDLFGSQLEVRRREAFRKERSLDSDETSGFVSKHSSETTDLSSRLSSTQFTTKHLSEPSGFGALTPGRDMSQHLSEPTDFGSRKFLSVDAEPPPSGMSTKREHFRKSKRLKHFNLRRIDDTDNDSSCDSDRPAVAADEVVEPLSTRLKEEVGLPKHLSRDSSVDRYGLYKSRSEKTITSFESDRIGQARLYDFESFCEAVTFTREKAASADETEIEEPEMEPRGIRRKSRSKRDISRRLKCLLL